ncbi:MAG: DUF373 family protein [Candidatus Norongarragalinales archaeon]
MTKGKRLLVLCADIDDDLGEKARVRGPVVGKKANLEAAAKLALADPADTDSNTIFEAVRVFDELREKNEVEIATLTGDARLGYAADANIARQLERVINDFRPEASVFVSDGASDERVLPLIQSRVKINSVRTLTMKQTKELEKTYFVILDKLKEPHFARIVFGIPGLALLLFAFSEFLGVRLFVGLIGAYLVLKGLGIEERLLKRVSLTSYSSFENISFVFYFAAIPLVAVSLWMAATHVIAVQYAGETSIAKLAAWFIKDLLLLLPIALLLIIAGNVLQAVTEEKKFLLPKQVVYGGSVFLFWLVFNNAADWILGTIAFSDFFYSLLLGVIAMFLLIYLSREFKKGIVSRLKLEGKEAYTEIGGLIGHVVGIDKKKDAFIVQTTAGQKIDLDFDHISNVGEKIIIKY